MSAEMSAPPAPVRYARTRWIPRGIGLLLLAGGLCTAWLYFRREEHVPRVEGAAALPRQPIEVGFVTLTPRTVPEAPRFLGHIEASQVVEIRSRVRGFLLERVFQEGQRVEKGQVLFRIDARPFEIELESAKASLGSAQARLEQAQLQKQRYEELFARGSAAPNELEEWQTAARVAAAEVEEEAARVAKAELDLGYTTLEAPLSGVIGRSQKDPGTYVDDAANGLLAVLSQVDPIYVRYSVSEQETLRWRRLEREGRVRIPALEELQLRLTLADETVHPELGRISFVDVRVDPSTGTTLVRGTVPNPDDRLKPGQFVHVALLGIERVDALLVPQRAVLQSPTGASVYVIGEDGQAEQRGVALSEWTDEDWVVESGLSAGERVITDHLLQVRPGTPVVPAAAAEPGAEGR